MKTANCLVFLIVMSVLPLPETRAAEPLSSKADFASKVTVSAIRAKKTKIEGGDFDDMKDRISFTIKLRNSDPNRPFPGLKIEFYLFGESMVVKRALQFLQKYEQTFELAPLQELILTTPEVVSAWDDTNAVFGSKYKGWYLLIRDASGQLLSEKSTSGFLSGIDGLPNLKVDQLYNRNLQPVKE